MADYNLAFYKKDAYKHPVGPVQLAAKESVTAANQPGLNEFIYLAKLDKNIYVVNFWFGVADLDSGSTGLLTITPQILDNVTVTDLTTAASTIGQAGGFKAMDNQAALGYLITTRNASLRLKISAAAETAQTGNVSFGFIGTNVGANPA